MKWIKFTVLALAALSFTACGGGDPDTYFTVKIENISNTSNLSTPFAPGVWATHSAGDLLFTENAADFGNGLEGLAETGANQTLATYLESNTTVDNTAKTTAIAPGSSIEFTVIGKPGQYLSFATMFVKSNDLFFAPADSGIALFSNGNPITGDITKYIRLWDCGTEANQVPGNGSNQPVAGSDSSEVADNSNTVRDINTFNDTFFYPEVDDLIKVTVSVEYR